MQFGFLIESSGIYGKSTNTRVRSYVQARLGNSGAKDGSWHTDPRRPILIIEEEKAKRVFGIHDQRI
jgi:hypothetical protein